MGDMLFYHDEKGLDTPQREFEQLLDQRVDVPVQNHAAQTALDQRLLQLARRLGGAPFIRRASARVLRQLSRLTDLPSRNRLNQKASILTNLAIELLEQEEDQAPVDDPNAND